MEKAKLYSPTQVAVGSFVGGPFAVVYTLWKNFRVLGNDAAAVRTLVWGALFVLAAFAVLPVLPEKFPNFVLPIAYSVGARLIADKLQMTKQAIAQSESYTFQSNWNVFGISVGFLLAFLAIALAWILGLDAVGVITL